MYGLISLIAAAQADIAPMPPPDKQFTTYTVQVDGLDKFPDAVLVLHDKDADTIYGYRPFSAEKASHQIANGHSSRGNTIHNPDFFLMTAEAFAAWSAETNAEIARQRDACSERGEGCVHISRFVPKFAPPTGTVPCNATVNIRTTAPQGGPSEYTDVFTVTAASAEGCTLTGPAAPAAAPSGSHEPEAAPADPAPSAEPAGSRCAAVTAAGGAAWGLALLLAGARRRR